MNIKEIAKKAGVSVATVSRVLNHPEVVCEQTKNHVLSVMKESNYTPNWFARGLNMAHTNTLALFVSNIESNINQDIIAGVDSVAHNKNYTVFLCNTRGEEETERNYLKMMSERRVDGVLFISSHLTDNELSEISKNEIPMIHVGRPSMGGDKNCCYINFEDAAYNLTKHLKNLGHQRIDLFLDGTSNSKTKAMTEGYIRANAQHQNEEIGEIHSLDNDSIKSGYMVAKKLFLSGDIPDAIFASSDDIAFGVMKAAKDMDIAIPDRLAVVGFSNSPMCGLITPELTSVEHPAKRLGMVAARMLFDLIEEDELALSVPREIVLQPKLKIRKSCGNKSYIFEMFE